MNHQPLFNELQTAQAQGQRLLAVLLDPDKAAHQDWSQLVVSLQQAKATHVFVGGSVVTATCGPELIDFLHAHLHLPVVLFPGDPSQLYPNADALLLLNLVSGRNPDYLIGMQVKAAPVLQKAQFEIWPTGYILVDGGTQTTVQRVSKTQAMDPLNVEEIVHTALAAQFMGANCVYLEAGSGALNPVPPAVIRQVREAISIPLLVGGGLRSRAAIEAAYQAGATLVVVGTALENDLNFFAYDSVS